MTIELYHTSHSTCSQKVRLTLAEKGLPERNVDWTEHDVDLNKFQQLTPEYLKMNPNGVVPTLVHDGVALYESSAILEYLDEVFPEPKMSPDTAVGRSLMRAWMRYIDEVPTVAVRVPTFANIIAPMRFGKTSDADFAAHAERLPLRKQFYQRMSQKGFGKAELDYSLFQMRQTAERIDKAVSESGGPFILGPAYSLVDAQVIPLIDRMDDLGYQELWDGLPHMQSWYAAVMDRPSYAATYYPGARISQKYPDHFRTAAEVRAERGY
ncbi:glutathione S-transferase family protein [Aquabacter spiritensis]|uniref:Glutathione S-transferase n=1 Tax=Aquabacter spiritensis TaxID=933073 RepID=A0A4R3LR12_9HYPH|nr:glutathione S-transferase family protein [Aquabacter spiritensis]TCT02943.1 glutathione S-transferase [Aquabacter spiritensis]